MLEVFQINIDKSLNTDVFYNLQQYISDEKRARIQRYKRYEDAQRCLIGDILARYAICRKSGLKNEQVVFGSNDYGKPVLLKPDGINTNISHSGDWVVCALGSKSVGIDIEVIKPIDLSIAERFFSREEYISLTNQPESIRLKYFYMIWTLKESYIKAEGNGLSIPLSSFSIKVEDKAIRIHADYNINKYNFFQTFLTEDAILAVCTLSEEYPDMISFNIEHFFREAMLIL